MHKKTLVIGASPDKNRFSYKAVEYMCEKGIEVVPLGIKEGEISGKVILNGFPSIKDVHTITLYVSSIKQKMYYDYIVSLKPKRIIFNPGSENVDFEQLLIDNHIEVIHACVLVMLNRNEY